MKTKFASSLMFALILSGCGGGGGSGPASSANPGNQTGTAPDPTVPTVPPTPTSPVTTNPTDPYTGQPASGTATAAVTGLVSSGSMTVAAVVTAYAVQPDGTNGASLGVSAPTGSDGKFSIQMAKVPSGMVRFVAVGGSFKSLADGTTQKSAVLELVTPYVTTELNNFVITPATHIVSHLVAYKAKSGAALANAYTSGVSTMLSLSAPNVLFKGDVRTGISLIKTLPGSSDDTLNSYQDLLAAIEWFGVRYDVPSSTLARVLSSYAEQDFPLNGVDGSNSAINVGKWVGTNFDETVRVSLDEVTAQRTADGSVVSTPTGGIVHDYAKGYISTNLIQYFYRVKACNDQSAQAALFLRYPNDATLFSDANLKAGVCSNNIKEITDLNARISTNNRSK